MAEQKAEAKVHVRITMETMGEEYQVISLLNSCTSLDLVKKMQAVLTEALNGLNK